jgi:hypothetical protein
MSGNFVDVASAETYRSRKRLMLRMFLALRNAFVSEARRFFSATCDHSATSLHRENFHSCLLKKFRDHFAEKNADAARTKFGGNAAADPSARFILPARW